MPSMFEIYDNYAFEYDELVLHEDYRNNLPGKLLQLFDFQDKTVIELGVGTGRVTKMYIDKAKKAYCYDQSAHMLQKAEKNLNAYSKKMELCQLNNLELGQIPHKADCVIEGWSFGHCLRGENEELRNIARKLISGCQQICKPDGSIFIIETLGSNVQTPAPPKEGLATFYKIMEEEYNFTRHTVQTDYCFATPAEAKRIFGFFFGEENPLSQKIDSCIVPEYTGIWHKKLNT